jgi:hypothetical protein
MKKKVIFILLCLLAVAPVASMRAKTMGAVLVQEQENKEVQQVDFEDFFNTDAEEPRAINRIKKKPLTKAQIILMQVGIKIAIACEDTYKWFRSVWRICTLWCSGWCTAYQNEESCSHEA